MKTIAKMAKKAAKWYFTQYAQIFNDKYNAYAYRIYSK